MRIISAAHITEPSADPSSLPAEFRLFSFGKNSTSKGDFLLDSAGAEQLIAAYHDHGNELAIDYEHQTFASANNGKPAPAAGWFKPEIRPDGIWATNVRWTDTASQMLRNKEYRYFSPTFEVDDESRITRLLPAALTNHPASKHQEPLIAARADAPMEPVMSNSISKILGLKDDAQEGETAHRVMALVQNEKELLSITGKETLGEALGAVIAMKDATVELEKSRVALKAWEERAAREEHEARQKEIIGLLDGAVMDGRVSLKDVDRLDQLKRHGEKFGIEALKTTIEMLSPRPVRHYQHPVPESGVKAQLKAVEEYKKSHPGVSTSDAYVALAAERPALFEHIGEEA